MVATRIPFRRLMGQKVATDHEAVKARRRWHIKEGIAHERRDERFAQITRRRPSDGYMAVRDDGSKSFVYKEGRGRRPFKHGTRGANRLYDELTRYDGPTIHNGYSLPTKAQHTNQILEFLGYTTEEEKRTYLRSFNGSAHHGADVLRAAYTIAQAFGLRDNLKNPNEQSKDIIKALAYHLEKNGLFKTPVLVNAVGIDNMPAFKDYMAVNIGGRMSFVPSGELEGIVIGCDKKLGSEMGHTLMAQMGYKRAEVSGNPVYTR